MFTDFSSCVTDPRSVRTLHRHCLTLALEFSTFSRRKTFVSNTIELIFTTRACVLLQNLVLIDSPGEHYSVSFKGLIKKNLPTVWLLLYSFAIFFIVENWMLDYSMRDSHLCIIKIETADTLARADRALTLRCIISVLATLFCIYKCIYTHIIMKNITLLLHEEITTTRVLCCCCRVNATSICKSGELDSFSYRRPCSNASTPLALKKKTRVPRILFTNFSARPTPESIRSCQTTKRSYSVS